MLRDSRRAGTAQAPQLLDRRRTGTVPFLAERAHHAESGDDRAIQAVAVLLVVEWVEFGEHVTEDLSRTGPTQPAERAPRPGIAVGVHLDAIETEVEHDRAERVSALMANAIAPDADPGLAVRDGSTP